MVAATVILWLSAGLPIARDTNAMSSRLCCTTACSFLPGGVRATARCRRSNNLTPRCSSSTRMCRLTASRVIRNSPPARVTLRCRATASNATRLLSGGNLDPRLSMTKLLRQKSLFSMNFWSQVAVTGRPACRFAVCEWPPNRCPAADSALSSHGRRPAWHCLR